MILAFKCESIKKSTRYNQFQLLPNHLGSGHEFTISSFTYQKGVHVASRLVDRYCAYLMDVVMKIHSKVH